ncbi:hypothetical protein BJ741DRAFT_600450 [Chytriomyces cf. hyalinus JEL632]|nr:hypothetical protein BJ741DRAFT_600450 [Chytriomyces cf. hyalinus JEL632]
MYSCQAAAPRVSFPCTLTLLSLTAHIIDRSRLPMMQYYLLTSIQTSDSNTLHHSQGTFGNSVRRPGCNKRYPQSSFFVTWALFLYRWIQLRLCKSTATTPDE